MTVFIDGHACGYELQRLTQMFFPGEKVAVERGAPPEGFAGDYLYAGYREGILEAVSRLGEGAPRALRAEAPAGETDGLEHRFGVLAYTLLSEGTGVRPPWGVLTGIRPVKLFAARMEAGLDETALRRHFMDGRLVSGEKFSLAMETAAVERELLARSTPDSFSLYVSVPFCPTRCAYCSFVSHSVEQAAKLIPDYVDRLCRELAATGALARELGLRLRTVYFGGGTPTTLTADQLSRVMDAVAAHFDVGEAWEYTVEAGRPDTVTEDKLRAIRAGGGRRVSINPQTLSDGVLAAIGRRHTAAQFFEAFGLARKVGFDCINADLIAGLPTDTPEGFCASVDGVLALAPENVTVHTLTVKRASRLSFGEARAELELVDGMVGYARGAAAAAGQRPYYLYRQNGTLANLENVGYSLPGREGLYNVYIMDETHTILAVGAGASTKLRHPVTGAIERVYNYKYPYEYLSRFDEVLRRKERVREFYLEKEIRGGACKSPGQRV
ncbi:coproporphyrinogen dehydrogenase HemZ [uncultured Anaerotruncus sp.]|uniref:coproporphyrinogen dehydrogenase HemZ n=1 Tax=uncultured Anaerotruncus sp. TaxID=905011 RepID=UPI00280C0973|nr:coproporphyrinogen dehydrogenase HemZ [uncultured Anaerotruncus sp.]